MPCGKGQRLGIFAGSGVGKSSLLAQITRGTDADVRVIGLIGERGREVREFLEENLGAEGMARTVVVVATSDEPPLVRLKAAFVATRIAEAFRDEGRDVLLLMDSITRTAMAQREVGLSAGEPPATRGYPPSVFAMMPQLLEKAGTGATGSITGLYTVLVEGDDHNEPIADTARSILDGHIVLTRKLATVGHFPAIDVLESISRVATAVVPPQQMADAREVRRLMGALRDVKELDRDRRLPGRQRPAGRPRPRSSRRAIEPFLQQPMGESTPRRPRRGRGCSGSCRGVDEAGRRSGCSRCSSCAAPRSARRRSPRRRPRTPPPTPTAGPPSTRRRWPARGMPASLPPAPSCAAMTLLRTAADRRVRRAAAGDRARPSRPSWSARSGRRPPSAPRAWSGCASATSSRCSTPRTPPRSAPSTTWSPAAPADGRGRAWTEEVPWTA